MNRIGIVGGAGPEAGVLLFQNIIRLYQRQGKWQDHEFPLITLLNFPFSSMMDQSVNQSVIVHELQKAIDYLILSSDKISIACNTLHVFVKYVNFYNVQFVSIVDTVLKTLKKRKFKKVLFLGTNTSVNNAIYYNDHTTIIYPESYEQQLLMHSIIKILQNVYGNNDVVIISNIIQAITSKNNIDAVILGCTEFSVLYQRYPFDLNIPVVDTIELLAQELI